MTHRRCGVMGRDLYHSKEDEISFSNICSVFAAASANSRNLGQKFSVDFPEVFKVRFLKYFQYQIGF
ncbi:Protein CBG25494 [Caenorhabditis briggsae]|uniref:Protein CBG25494 n=1 Tax=Caenorhabditis briggsae TaxID=6238 RepID=B6IEN4_CAEBR|nr:Protein CBG25494 [Caenorhabditis briggsae]CAR98364.1 Protein CBG25494 [Caenorhabditis briggsae]